MKTIKDININDKTVFIRCDFNIPKDKDGNITDDRRIRESLQTIRYCIDRNCKIILASHYERPTPNRYEDKFSLKPVKERLSILLKIASKIIISKNVVGEDSREKVKNLKAREVLILENLRYEEGEIKNDVIFAKKLANFADIYINDAFGACHRKHASIYAMAKEFDKDKRAIGFLMNREILFFEKILNNPIRPFVAVIGGSKVSGKLQALIQLVKKVDKIIIGGGMAFTFLKAIGYEIGNSLVENELIEDAKNIMREAKKRKVKFYLPVDIIVASEISEVSSSRTVPAQEIPDNKIGLDIGLASIKLFQEVLSDAETIIWNGPMGVYEIDKFAKGSTRISHFIADSESIKIIGGGDTADVVQKAGDSEEMSFISTGGGASLNLIEGKKLPGLEAFL